MITNESVRSRVRDGKSLLRDCVDLTLTRVGLGQPESMLARDAETYWRGRAIEEEWRSDSHWRDGGALDEETWRAIGADHFALYEKFARAAGVERPLRRIVEWGCGGGANAVWFAPKAEEFIAVDVATDSLVECERQVRDFCETTFTPVLADVANPEFAAGQITDGCDLFLCFYVFELVPTPEYGLRLLRIASNLLADDGIALVQIKYGTGSWRTRPRRRRYRQSVLASMTTYRIEEFWTAAADCGLQPQLVSLVPKNAVDERYAYFLLRKAG